MLAERNLASQNKKQGGTIAAGMSPRLSYCDCKHFQQKPQQNLWDTSTQRPMPRRYRNAAHTSLAVTAPAHTHIYLSLYPASDWPYKMRLSSPVATKMQGRFCSSVGKTCHGCRRTLSPTQQQATEGAAPALCETLPLATAGKQEPKRRSALPPQPSPAAQARHASLSSADLPLIAWPASCHS